MYHAVFETYPGCLIADPAPLLKDALDTFCCAKWKISTRKVSVGEEEDLPDTVKRVLGAVAFDATVLRARMCTYTTWRPVTVLDKPYRVIFTTAADSNGPLIYRLQVPSNIPQEVREALMDKTDPVAHMIPRRQVPFLLQQEFGLLVRGAVEMIKRVLTSEES